MKLFGKFRAQKLNFDFSKILDKAHENEIVIMYINN